MSEAVPRIEVKEVAPGFVSVHVYEDDGTHWSSDTLVQSDRLYGPFTPGVSESLVVTRGVLTMVPKDTTQRSFDMEPFNSTVTMRAGETFYLLARTSVSYLCDYMDEPEDAVPADDGDKDGEVGSEGKPEDEPEHADATPRAEGDMIVPPRPAPPRGSTAHTGTPAMPRPMVTFKPIGTPPDGTGTPDDTEGGEPGRDDPHAGKSHE